MRVTLSQSWSAILCVRECWVVGLKVAVKDKVGQVSRELGDFGRLVESLSEFASLIE